jgi:hypothetical protein
MHTTHTIKAESLRNLNEAAGAEAALGVNVQRLALSAALVHWQLARDAQGVTQLAFARPKLAKQLSDRARFHAAWETGRGHTLALITQCTP